MLKFIIVLGFIISLVKAAPIARYQCGNNNFNNLNDHTVVTEKSSSLLIDVNYSPKVYEEAMELAVSFDGYNFFGSFSILKNQKSGEFVLLTFKDNERYIYSGAIYHQDGAYYLRGVLKKLPEDACKAKQIEYEGFISGCIKIL